MVSADRKPVVLSSSHHLVAGAVAGVLSRFIVQPFDVIKIRQQLESSLSVTKDKGRKSLHILKYRSITQSLSVIYREESIRGLWKGHVPAQVMSVAYGAIQFACYERWKRILFCSLPYSTTGKSSALIPVIDFLSGGLSGICATLTCHPLDTMRTRFIAQEHKAYTSIWHGAVSMAREGGLRTYYKGLSPALVSIFPLVGLQFCSYGLLQRLWRWTFGHDQVSKLRSLVCGGVAGVTSKVVLLPLDVVRKRLQVQGFNSLQASYITFTPFTGLLDGLKRTAKEEGMLALFKGARPSVVKAGLLVSLSFFTYEESCKVIIWYKSCH